MGYANQNTQRIYLGYCDLSAAAAEATAVETNQFLVGDEGGKYRIIRWGVVFSEVCGTFTTTAPTVLLKRGTADRSTGETTLDTLTVVASQAVGATQMGATVVEQGGTVELDGSAGKNCVWAEHTQAVGGTLTGVARVFMDVAPSD